MQSMKTRQPLLFCRGAAPVKPRAFAVAAGIALLAMSVGAPYRELSAQSSPARALVLDVRGDARVLDVPDDAPGRALKKNSTVPAGAEIRTGPRSAATLQLSPTLICRLGANTVVRLEALKGDARLRLAQGSVGAQAQPNTGTRMQIVTPTVIAGVRGTEFIVETAAENAPAAPGLPDLATGDAQAPGGESQVLVNEGVVAVSAASGAGAADSQPREVTAGNKIVSDGETLRLSILEEFERQKFEIFEEFGKLKKQNYEAYLEQVRRNEELREEMERLKNQR